MVLFTDKSSVTRTHMNRFSLEELHNVYQSSTHDAYLRPSTLPSDLPKVRPVVNTSSLATVRLPKVMPAHITQTVSLRNMCAGSYWYIWTPSPAIPEDLFDTTVTDTRGNPLLQASILVYHGDAANARTRGWSYSGPHMASENSQIYSMS